MSNVFTIDKAFFPPQNRLVEALSLENFCLADAGSEWVSRHTIQGMTILQYPRAIMICTAGGECTLVRHTAVDTGAYFCEALRELDEPARFLSLQA